VVAYGVYYMFFQLLGDCSIFTSPEDDQKFLKGLFTIGYTYLPLTFSDGRELPCRNISTFTPRDNQTEISF
jgi:hypothetical protein